LPAEGVRFHLILNAYWEPLSFELPPRDDAGPWLRWIDTSLASPEDVVEWKAAPPVENGTYPVGPRSVVMLYSEIN
jgi:glycogen operon protein